MYRTRLAEVLKEEQKSIPEEKIKIAVQIVFYTVFIVMVRGGRAYPSIFGLEQCNMGSWVCVILHIVLSYLYSKSIAIMQFQKDI